MTASSEGRVRIRMSSYTWRDAALRVAGGRKQRFAIMVRCDGKDSPCANFGETSWAGASLSTHREEEKSRSEEVDSRTHARASRASRRRDLPQDTCRMPPGQDPATLSRDARAVEGTYLVSHRRQIGVGGAR